MNTGRSSRYAAGSAALLLLASLVSSGPASAQNDPTPNQDTYVDLRATDNVGSALAWNSLFADGSADEVLIGRDDLFADNLASGSLQGVDDGAPLLLTPSDSLDQRVVDELARLGATTVHLLGGAQAVSAEVEADLRGLGLNVERHFGENRFETAVAISFLLDSDTAIIARGVPGEDPTQAFADSLAAGAWAADENWPVLFTETNNLTDATADALRSGGYTAGFVVGGPSAISDSVFDEIGEIFPVQRIWGPTRFETAVEIAEARGFLSAGQTRFPVLVDGHAAQAWADGFSAAALGALGDAPVILSGSGDGRLPDATRDWLVGGGTPGGAVFLDPDTGLVCGPSVPDPLCGDAAGLRGLNTRQEFFTRADPSPGPFTGSTAGPDLLDVNIIDGIPNNGIPNGVRFRFDKPLVEINPFLFSVQGFDSQTRQGPASGAIDSNDDSAAIIQFLDSIDLRNFTIGTAEGGAVGDGTQQSILRSAPLGGAAPSSGGAGTSAPDLTNVTTNSTAQQKTYFFDQPVQNPVPNLFGFYTPSGSVNFGDSIVALSGTQNAVVVQFGAGGLGVGADPVEAGVRDFVDDTSPANIAGDGDSAVEGQTGGTDNPAGHSGSTTSAPDLTGASKVPGQPGQFDFQFDENVSGASAAPGNFGVYRDDGTRLTPNSCAQNGPATLRCGFPGLDQNSIANIVRAAVNAAATTAAAAPNEPNTVGASDLDSAPVPAGRTDGPDLVDVNFDNADTSNTVTFMFDEAIDDTGANPANPSSFFVYDASGRLIGVGNSLTISGSNAAVTFGGGLGAAAGAGVVSPTGTQPGVGAGTPGAQDFQGNDNSPQSVGGGPAASGN